MREKAGGGGAESALVAVENENPLGEAEPKADVVSFCAGGGVEDDAKLKGEADFLCSTSCFFVFVGRSTGAGAISSSTSSASWSSSSPSDDSISTTSTGFLRFLSTGFDVETDALEEDGAVDTFDRFEFVSLRYSCKHCRIS